MRIRFRPTYAHVTSTLALVVALGGTAVAAGLAPGSVGTPQLKNRAVTAPKLGVRAVGPGHLDPAASSLARSGPPTTVAGNITDLPPVPAGGAYRRQRIDGSGVSVTSLQAAVLSPATAATAARFRGAIRQDLPDGASVAIQLVARDALNAAETAVLGCTVVGGAGPDDTRCATSGRVTIPPGSFLHVLVSVEDYGPGSAEPEGAFWSFELTSAP